MSASLWLRLTGGIWAFTAGLILGHSPWIAVSFFMVALFYGYLGYACED